MSTEIYYWPDDSWCYEDDLHIMTHLSDDYTLLELEDETWEEIDEIVAALNGGHDDTAV